MILLHWLKTSPNFLNTYVANRVNLIQKLSIQAQWGHVISSKNPADFLTRGQLKNEFKKIIFGDMVQRGCEIQKFHDPFHH